MGIRWKKYENLYSGTHGYGCNGEIGQYSYDCTICTDKGNWKWFVDIDDDGACYASEGRVRGTTPEALKLAKKQAMASCLKLLAQARRQLEREYARNVSNYRKMENRFKSP